MTCNMGTADRILRGIVGLTIIGLGFMYDSLWGFLGLVPLFTSLVGWCPAYIPFGISTMKKCEMPSSESPG